MCSSDLVGLGDVQDVGQQVTQLQDVDATLAHEVDEDIVVTLGLGHVEDVIEEQVVGLLSTTLASISTLVFSIKTS